MEREHGQEDAGASTALYSASHFGIEGEMVIADAVADVAHSSPEGTQLAKEVRSNSGPVIRAASTQAHIWVARKKQILLVGLIPLMKKL